MTDGERHRRIFETRYVLLPLTCYHDHLTVQERRTGACPDPTSVLVVLPSPGSSATVAGQPTAVGGVHETLRGQRDHAAADEFIRSFGYILPPFAYWSVEEFDAAARQAGIIETRLGWDITDYGQGKFGGLGLFLFTVRNGRTGPAKGGASSMPRRS